MERKDVATRRETAHSTSHIEASYFLDFPGCNNDLCVSVYEKSIASILDHFCYAWENAEHILPNIAMLWAHFMIVLAVTEEAQDYDMFIREDVRVSFTCILLTHESQLQF